MSSNFYFISLCVYIIISIGVCAITDGSVFFVGSYSNSISAYSFSKQTGEISFVNSTTDSSIDQPSWLVMSNSKRYLYAVSEIDNYDGRYTGAISSYLIDTDTFRLTFINKVATHGAAPCHAAVNAEDSALFISNYCSGTIAVVPLLIDGSLGNATQVIDHNPDFAPVIDCDGAHVHEVVLHHSGAVLSNDLGLDRVYEYQLHESKDGLPVLLRPQPILPFVQLASGSGPRHLVFHPSAEVQVLYLISELENTVSVLAYHEDTRVDEVSGTSAAIQIRFLNKLSTLPPPYTGVDMAAGEIQISPDGRFVYCSNRDVSDTDPMNNLGRSSLSVFLIMSEGTELKYLQTISSFGVHPRHFILYDKYVIIANRDSANLVVLPRDPNTGLLSDPSERNGVFTWSDLIAPTQVLMTDL